MVKLLISNNNKFLAQCQGQEIHLWEIEKQTIMKTLKLAIFTFHEILKFNSDDTLLATFQAHKPFEIFLFQVHGEINIYIHRLAQEERTEFLCFLNDRQHLLSITKKGSLRIWEFEKSRQIILKKISENIIRASYNEIQEQLICQTEELEVFRFSMNKELELIAKWKPHNKVLYTWAYLSQKNYLITSGDSCIKIWDIARLKQIIKPIRILSIQNIYNIFVFSNNKCVYGKNFKMINLWNLQVGKLIKSYFPSGKTSFTISADQQIIVFCESVSMNQHSKQTIKISNEKNNISCQQKVIKIISQNLLLQSYEDSSFMKLF